MRLQALPIETPDESPAAVGTYLWKVPVLR
jgi:hypothetical protein